MLKQHEFNLDIPVGQWEACCAGLWLDSAHLLLCSTCSAALVAAGACIQKTLPGEGSRAAPACCLASLVRRISSESPDGSGPSLASQSSNFRRQIGDQILLAMFGAHYPQLRPAHDFAKPASCSFQLTGSPTKGSNKRWSF